MKKVSIVTVNFNHSHITEALLASIALKNTYANLEIIVVDNASSVNPVPQWKLKYQGITFIRSNSNLGFAGGNNLGIKAAKGDYLFLINNDTEITEGLVEGLVGILDTHPEVGMVSPKIKYFDEPDTLQYAGYTPMNYYTARNSCIGMFEKDNGQYDQLVGKTGFVHGAAMMVKREAIDKVGLMAENYFLYYEELDWCDRIKQRGFEAWVNMKVTIYHKESVSVGKKSALKEYFMNRNRILFTRRNAPFIKRMVFYCHYMFLVLPRNMWHNYKNGNKSYNKQLYRAIWWNITNDRDSPYLGYEL